MDFSWSNIYKFIIIKLINIRIQVDWLKFTGNDKFLNRDPNQVLIDVYILYNYYL